MSIPIVTLDALLLGLRGGPGGVPFAGIGDGLLLVDLDSAEVPPRPPALHTGVAAIIVGVTSDPRVDGHPAAAVCDVVLPHGSEAVDAVVSTVATNPIAARALALLLRGSASRSVDDGLLAESATYSSLQAGPEFSAWRASRPPRPRRPEGDPVRLRREGGALHVTLDRPAVRNALDAAMRDALVEAFSLPLVDDSIVEVHLRGAGASFCAGGDLDEFGSFADPASAHVLRLRQSVGRVIAQVGDRVTAHLHGACVGSGIELPAFAGTVVADPSTVIALPEVALGLVPGAGGTVSLPRRIGRHRTARLALTGEQVDAATAMSWGLVDAVERATGA
jgi:hypothetical protein